MRHLRVDKSYYPTDSMMEVRQEIRLHAKAAFAVCVRRRHHSQSRVELAGLREPLIDHSVTPRTMVHETQRHMLLQLPVQEEGAHAQTRFGIGVGTPIDHWTEDPCDDRALWHVAAQKFPSVDDFRSASRYIDTLRAS